MSTGNDATTRLWDELGLCMESFLAAWEKTPGPPLIEHVPSGLTPMIRAFIAAELVKIDLEQRLARGEWPRLERYLGDFPELLIEGEPAVELIYEEWHLRKASGEQIRLGEFRERFPLRFDAFCKLAGERFVTTTSLGTKAISKRLGDRLKPGEKLDDDFELRAELGSGAFGRVFLAWQASMQRLVALKIAAKIDFEPQALAQLDHPHIVRVYDMRTLVAEKVRLLYMQFCAGGTLADIVSAVRNVPFSERNGGCVLRSIEDAMRRAQQVPPEETSARRRFAKMSWAETVCRIGMQLAAALAYAHEKKIFHRDVKPANVLLTAEGIAKLADFNISFAGNVAGASADAFFGGSLAYMSPEQLEAVDPESLRKPDELDARADLFSAAVVLWELLFAERPFDDTVAEVSPGKIAGVLAKNRRAGKSRCAEHLRLTNDPTTRRLAQVLMRAMSPDPQDRPVSGHQLARELGLCLNPSSWDLLQNLSSGPRDFARRHPLLTIVGLNFVPHVFAGAYNFFFNKLTLIAPQHDPVIDRAFEKVCLLLNGTFFPAGLIAGIMLCLPMRRVAQAASLTSEARSGLRLSALRLGGRLSLLALGLWAAAGLAFPAVLHAFAGRFPAGGYLHFFLAQTACGLIAAVFPFLATSWIAVRVFYPASLGSDTPDDLELARLRQLTTEANLFFNAAGGVVLLSLLLQRMSSTDNFALTIILLSAGLIGWIIAFVIDRAIQRDVSALLTALETSEEGESDTMTISRRV